MTPTDDAMHAADCRYWNGMDGTCDCGATPAAPVGDDPIVTAQHDETGREWTGRRSAIPRRFAECASPPVGDDAIVIEARKVMRCLYIAVDEGVEKKVLFAAIDSQAARIAELERQLAAIPREPTVAELRIALGDLLDVIAVDWLIPETVSYMQKARHAIKMYDAARKP